MTPPWLLLAFDDALPDLVGADRDRLAARVLDHIPADLLAVAIAESAKTVLEQRNIKDGAGDLSREIGRNAAQRVLYALEGEPSPGEQDAAAVAWSGP